MNPVRQVTMIAKAATMMKENLNQKIKNRKIKIPQMIGILEVIVVHPMTNPTAQKIETN
jgi:hypothetical protein